MYEAMTSGLLHCVGCITDLSRLMVNIWHLSASYVVTRPDMIGLSTCCVTYTMRIPTIGTCKAEHCCDTYGSH